jgi:hypothetical protein
MRNYSKGIKNFRNYTEVKLHAQSSFQGSGKWETYLTREYFEKEEKAGLEGFNVLEKMQIHQKELKTLPGNKDKYRIVKETIISTVEKVY